jgi:hypothetical protein
MSIIESIYNFILTCPLLKEKDGYVVLNVDYSNGQDATTYSISPVPCNPVLKEYLGGTDNQFLFTLSSVEYFGVDPDVNKANIAFYEGFKDWLKLNNDTGVLPNMEDTQNPYEIKALTGAYLQDNQADMSKARYVITCQLKYDEIN